MWRDLTGYAIFAFCTYFVLLCAFYIFFDITAKGLPVLMDKGTDFLTKSPETLVVFKDEADEIVQMPMSEYSVFRKDNPAAVIRDEHTHSYSAGGIMGPLVGTALLVIVCMLVALTTGVATAIFLNEYARKGRFLNLVRLAIMNLAGVPSIVFGLFGLGVFCLWPWLPVLTYEPSESAVLVFAVPFTDGWLSFQGWGTSILAGGFTLAIMVLPVIITACEEALKAVPMGFREAAMALGATKWQAIRTAVLPYAKPGIMTASILGVTRVAGETAPIMFTAALAHKGALPWQEAKGSGLFWLSDFLTQSVQALPYHIYTVSARIPQSEYTEPMQSGSVFVFMLLVMIFAGLSIYLRGRYRKNLKW
ncbi:MAG: PstA family ABC transporter permease [Verrucomicrobia bacterium]|nr:PstA family ABC transporter permease [Verrucomicrobiota bacterium]MDA1006909.1 PstA family ABC transporter permease [Verrucomicrobiota bacterium]